MNNPGEPHTTNGTVPILRTEEEWAELERRKNLSDAAKLADEKDWRNQVRAGKRTPGVSTEASRRRDAQRPSDRHRDYNANDPYKRL
jgi:hypothetical protein